MQNLLSSTPAQTMSSLEIAKLTGKQHKHVIVDIESLLAYYLTIYSAEKSAQLVKTGTYKDSSNKSNKCYLLSKEAALDLITGYSLPHRHAVNQRWLELESQQQPFKVPTNFIEAMQLATATLIENQSLQAKIENDKPKVEFADAIRNTDARVSIGDFAKVIGTGQNRLFERLRQDGFLMSNNRPYQSSIDRGLMVSIEQKPHVDTNGVSHPSFKTLITGKGQVFFEKKYRSNPVNQPRLQLVQK